MKVRKHYVFSGRVQGVGFRYTMQRYASHLGLTGWVKNLYNGNVEAYVQGEESKIIELLRYLNNDHYIVIRHMEVNLCEFIDNEKGFIVKY